MTQQQLDIIKGIVKRIENFDKACNAAQHTDTGEAWDLFDAIKKDLKALLKTEPMEEV